MTHHSFNIIYREHYRYLCAFARSLVGDEFYEDVVADSFINLWNNPSKYHSNPRHFLSEFIKWRCLGILKHNKRAARIHKEIKYQSEYFIEAMEIKADLLSIVSKEIENLPPGRKKVMKLIMMGYDSVEISEMLGISQNTTRTQTKRFRDYLKLKIQL